MDLQLFSSMIGEVVIINATPKPGGDAKAARMVGVLEAYVCSGDNVESYSIRGLGRYSILSGCEYEVNVRR